ncbi:hypothetical protein BDZ89DRAFT_1070125 [Hymenopellis radicata]|nr:hypothetical protein BDZ89DRAFT_1070125 [Hymenopellis radicata]
MPIDADLNDADDSIVLSDLVRTGEASRLRRRGAMRLDHHTTAAQTAAAADGATWEPDETPRLHREKEEYLWTLFCGGEEEQEDDEFDEYHHAAFEPSLFPLCPASAPSRPTTTRQPRRTNGCGALVHMRAAPRGRLGVWTAKTRASDAVVSLDNAYFDRTAVSKIVRSACGCVREGVGCAVCGNPLGTRYRPCKTAEDGIFVPHASHPRPHPHPDGPAYWHDSAASTPPPDFYIYTFFSSAVSSAPTYSFSSRPAHIRQHHPPQQIAVYSQPPPLVDLDDSLMFSRTITSSPVPLSDVGEEDDREGGYAMASNWAEFANSSTPLDPDGDDTPNSPDKSNEVMLFPER